jgi:phosphoribosylformylglycinamidine synthase II
MENTEIQIDSAKAEELGLLSEEFERIQEILGRTPNFTELSVFSGMWSEHCSYKNSILWLKTLPQEGPSLLAGAGEENAGLVDIGDGYACAFKIESHNHPSAIEPYQGAATGVGGINRDIFTMGARPIAQLNSLRFGDPAQKRPRWHFKGAVQGIGDYGNSFGIPVVGGEVYFDPCYETNPLINAMSAGIVRTDRILSATASGPGNPVYIVGSATGKDGIHGAAFASRSITEASGEDIPAVQVGDAFQEKLLLEATMELKETDAVVGMQDMGAAGITCSTSEMSADGGVGMRIDLDRVPLRQQNMEPFEILLSESQERMLVVIEDGKEEEVEAIFEKWDLNCAKIGEVTEETEMVYHYKGEEVARIPAESLVLGGGAPRYEREYEEPAYMERNRAFSKDDVEEPEDLKAVAEHLLTRPSIASKRWVTEQYDTMVGTRNLSTNHPTDAGLVMLKGSKRALAFSTDCNARYVEADPKRGAAIAVAEAARNISCSGAEPKGISNCLNFGDPYDPEVYWQFVNAIKGMGEACEAFGTPVTGGNVSFYNQIEEEDRTVPVFPSPVIGMMGSMEDREKMMTLDMKEKGDLIYLLGEVSDDINASEYLVSWHGIRRSLAPHFDLGSERKLQSALRDMIGQNAVRSAHDVSDGGLFVSLVEKGIPGGYGFDIESDGSVRKDAFLFGEGQGRVIVTASPGDDDSLIDLAGNHGVPITLLGHVTRGKMMVDGEHYGFMRDAEELYEGAIPSLMEEG